MLRRVALALVAPLVAISALAVPAGAAGSSSLTIGKPLAQSLPAGFVGLTAEVGALSNPIWDPGIVDPAHASVTLAVTALGDQGILRFGGTSADRDIAWQHRPSDPRPGWARGVVTPEQLKAVARLATATGWSVDLAVNLYHDDPAAAADEVATAAKILGASLRDVKIGNEPELYSFMYPKPMSFEQWVVRWSSYRRAISARAPEARFSGPDFYLPIWLSGLAGTGRQVIGSLSELADHFYPWADCGSKGRSIGQLLSESSYRHESSDIAKLASVAGPRGLPIALDEMNSISCGSSDPVQWQAASALWGVRALLLAAQEGVSSVGIQMNPQNCSSYTPLCITGSPDAATLSPKPLNSALSLVAGLEGGRFLRLRAGGSPLPVGTAVWALRYPNGSMRVVLANTSSQAIVGLSLLGAGGLASSAMSTLTVPDLASTETPSLVSDPVPSSLTDLSVPAQSVRILTLTPTF